MAPKDTGAGATNEGFVTVLNEKVDEAAVLGGTLTDGVVLRSPTSPLDGDMEFVPALFTISLRADSESLLFC